MQKDEGEMWSGEIELYVGLEGALFQNAVPNVDIAADLINSYKTH